jgi:hypothetical protein
MFDLQTVGEPGLLEITRERMNNELETFFEQADFIDRVEQYLNELESSDGLRVVLVPPAEETNVGGMIRAAESRNPAWYRKFCSQYMSIRGRGRKRYKRARTMISRIRTVQALRRILAGDRSGVYAERITELINRELENERQAFRAAVLEPEPEGERMPF